MEKHTATPWEVEKWSYEDGKRIEIVIVGEKDKIATMDSLYRPVDDYEESVKIADDEKHANAAFIVRAVNAHDDLVAALESIIDWHDVIKQNYPEMVSLISGMDLAKTALENAKG